MVRWLRQERVGILRMAALHGPLSRRRVEPRVPNVLLRSGCDAKIDRRTMPVDGRPVEGGVFS